MLLRCIYVKFKNAVMCIFIFHMAAHREEHIRNLNCFSPVKLIILFIYLFILIHVRTKDCCVQLSRPV